MPAPRSGVLIQSPEYEWREAARFGRLSYTQFRRLNIHEQVAIIAHYRTHNQVEAVVAHANRPKKTPSPARPRRRSRRR